jgi:FkbM family methyltransferase
MSFLTPINRLRVWLLYRFRRAAQSKFLFAVDNLTFEIDPSNSLDRQLFLSGNLEPDLLALRRFVRHLNLENSTFVDVGANSGHWTVGLSKTFSKVLAFEPNDAVRLRLTRNVSLNSLSNVLVSPLALSDQSGEATMFIRESLDNSGALNDGLSTLMNREGHLRSSTVVTTATLDSIDFDLDFGVIKIDVEGAENLVLAGAKETLTRTRPIVVSEVLLGDNGHQTVTERLTFFPKNYLHFKFHAETQKLEEVKGAMSLTEDFNLISMPAEQTKKLQEFSLID